MSKIERDVKGAWQVIKTFHNDQLYLDGTAINIKDDRLSSELAFKGLIEKRKVEVAKPNPRVIEPETTQTAPNAKKTRRKRNDKK